MKQSTTRCARRRPAAVRELRLTPLMLSLVCLGMTPALAQVLPVPAGGGANLQAVPGGGTVNIVPGAPAGTMNIQQDTARAIAQWQSFSIGAGGVVNVAQPSSSSILLSRVVGNEMSTIAGSLNATGHVFLTNPNGVLFSSGSSVSVGGLVATTMKLATSDSDFMNPAVRQFRFERTSPSPIVDGNSYAIVNQGTITTTSPGATVALMGSNVSNEGIINVARGSVGLVSADTITVDFNGDGLTKFIIPSDSPATSALVKNSGTITADGGRIALMAASNAMAQVVNQSGVLRANTLESRNGEIILSAGQTTNADGSTAYKSNGMVVSGTIEAAGGQVRMYSGQDITVTNLPPYAANSSTAVAPIDSGSIINADALSHTLGNAGGVTLESAALPGNVPPVRGWLPGDSVSSGEGVRFDSTANVVKSEGGTATLTVNSARNIFMEFDSKLSSSSGALNVDFNADSQGTLSVDGRPGGAIAMSGATIESNGGDIRFYGQSDPVNGRAAGGDQTGPYAKANGLGLEGIRIADSTVSTCAQGQAACSGAGSISLRGQGGTVTPIEGTIGNSGVGVALYDAQLRSGSGAIAVDGLGGIGASGVLSTGTEGGNTSIESAAGDVRITGRTRDWDGNNQVFYRSVDSSMADIDFGGGNGVTLLDTSITTGGGVTLNGTGAVLSNAANANSATGIVGSSSGVVMNNSPITAGAGRQVSITGTAGSNGFTYSLDTSENLVFTPDTSLASAVSLSASFGQGAIAAEGGGISIQGGTGDVSLTYVGEGTGDAISLLNVASANRAGGSIDVGGRNILIANNFDPTANFIDASGAGGGGTITVRGTGGIAVDQNVGMAADAAGTAAGNGGTIRVVADGDLRSYGSYSARGGQQGGNGGLVETSGANFDLTGIRVDASAPLGTAGTWLLDPATVTIASGTASGSLPGDPFAPLFDSTVQDGDINAALNKGTSVTIATTAPNGNSTGGDIFFNEGVLINVTNGTSPVNFNLQAWRNISGFSTTIQSSAAPLNLNFAAGLSGNSGTISLNSGGITTNGGNVTMTALGNGFGSCALCLSSMPINTLGTAGDGSVNLSVPAPGSTVPFGGFTTAALDLVNTDITAGRGNVDLSGFAQNGTGVRVQGSLFSVEGGQGVITTTTGNINITGVGAFSSNSSDGSGHGVVISNARVASTDGNIAVRGLRQVSGDESGPPPGNGVLLQNGAQIATTGVGDIEVTGETQGAGAGLVLTAAITDPQLVNYPASTIDGNRNVVLRASNDGSSDAVVLNGTVRAGQVLNLRPGGVNAATGAGENRTANPISLMGGTGATGYAISADEMSRLTAATVVVGGSTHAANIDVLAPMASSVPLTLQNNAGGNITLNAPISAPTLGLISGGNITQAAGASITAGTLLAQSFGGNVILADPGNTVSVNTLAGGAAGRFEFVNSGPLRLGPVSVTAFDSNSNLPQQQAASSMAADTMLVRTLSGELILDTGVTTANGADLVAATTFQNPGGGSLGGAPWRVWADTWVGESRGGLVGSGQLPNLYHCAYLGVCTVTVTPGDNHFIYAQQPTLTVNIGNFARPVGQPNPSFTYTLAGLILGDTGAGVAGTTGTTADLQSPAGLYPVFGTFTSAEGYAVNVVQGQLLVSNVPLPPPAPPSTPVVLPQPARFVEVLREEPTTYLYDRNIGQAPICLATGPLDGERAQQGNDILAREWSRVRTRPNLISCVDTERSNGCSDF
ncbi:MAG: filamentous hemagglutinin N-terminal domain-containing protein [Proteobacteria bacterium]|nr:filamentous hemagglutinin N-terminal domain-containing protein [Pseudomonadota bacterium]